MPSAEGPKNDPGKNIAQPLQAASHNRLVLCGCHAALQHGRLRPRAQRDLGQGRRLPERLHLRRPHLLYGQWSQPSWLSQEVFDPHLPQETPEKGGIALLAASTACYLLYGLFPGEFYAAQPVADTFGPIAYLKGLYLCKIESVYWFLYAILRIYLLTPFIALAIEKRPDAEKYLLFGGFVSAFALPALLHGHPNLVAANPMPAPFTSSSLFYFVLGHYLDQNLDRLLDGVRRNRAMVVCVALALVSVGTSYVLTRIFNSPTRFSAGLWEPGKPYDGYWCSAGGILAVPYAASLFTLAHCAEARLQRMDDAGAILMSRVTALTFGIYLVHNPMLRWMSMHVVGARHGSFGILLASHPLAKGIVAAIASALMVAAGRWAIAQTKALLARQGASA